MPRFVSNAIGRVPRLEILYDSPRGGRWDEPVAFTFPTNKAVDFETKDLRLHNSTIDPTGLFNLFRLPALRNLETFHWTSDEAEWKPVLRIPSEEYDPDVKTLNQALAEVSHSLKNLHIVALHDFWWGATIHRKGETVSCLSVFEHLESLEISWSRLFGDTPRQLARRSQTRLVHLLPPTLRNLKLIERVGYNDGYHPDVLLAGPAIQDGKKTILEQFLEDCPAHLPKLKRFTFRALRSDYFLADNSAECCPTSDRFLRVTPKSNEAICDLIPEFRKLGIDFVWEVFQGSCHSEE
ncbi:hypothetical protein F4778DRAFT_779104 [Xylariomycetidae sp. FL2044]|nr:hypothetical protein F4778DRAFT_779104 [Xylariomycetidae sp. FL2044]